MTDSTGSPPGETSPYVPASRAREFTEWQGAVARGETVLGFMEWSAVQADIERLLARDPPPSTARKGTIF